MVSGLKISALEALPTATTHTVCPPAAAAVALEPAGATPLAAVPVPVPETATLMVVPCAAGTAPLATMPPPAFATPDAPAADVVELLAAAPPAMLTETVLAE